MYFAKDHWQGFNTRNGNSVHIVNYIPILSYDWCIHLIRSPFSFLSRICLLGCFVHGWITFHRKVSHTENRGAAHFAAHGLHVGNGVGCPWAAHGNFALQIRLPTTSIYGNVNSRQLNGQLSRQPTTSKYEKSGQLSGHRSGLPMGCPWEFCHAN